MYLNTHSYYSYRYGIMSPKELLKEAKDRQITHLALTDINNTSACLNFARLAQKEGITPLLGVDFRNNVSQQYIGIAKNNTGFQEINEHLSLHLHKNQDFKPSAPNWKNVIVIYPYKHAIKHQLTLKLGLNEYIGINPYEINQLHIDFLKKKLPKERLIAFNTCTFRHQKDFNRHRILRAIDNNTLLSKLDKGEQGNPNHIFRHPTSLQESYLDFHFLIDNAQQIMENCTVHFSFDGSIIQNQKSYLNTLEEDFKQLRFLCYSGLLKRYRHVSTTIKDRLKKELETIYSKQAVSYFLINWDIVQYARRKGYFYVGRGSGANSIVAYLLYITDVDPIELDLYFERFMNLYRKNPPDFDLDFSSRDREDVTRYIFHRFPHVTLLGSHVTFQYRAAIREVGKVLGLPNHEIDQLTKPYFNEHDQLQLLTLKYAKLIEGLPSHPSIHAGGILISEKKISHFTSTFLPPKGFPTTHFDMLIAEDIGLHKFDILGQRGLAKIKDALESIKKKHTTTSIDIHDIESIKNDPKVKTALREARAIGCFYIESPAMRMLLKKLEADDYLGLVAASSIIRPGVAKSGMMREYILRFRDPEQRKQAHPILLQIMPDTYGVMVYQEDVIKVAHYYAGLTLEEADVLRRGMSGKYRSRDEFNKVKQRFFDNCNNKGHPEKDTKEIWRQIESFAGYAFAKGHSASYAVESFQSLYLKVHYPLEFMVAILNNGGGFYSKELYIHEARMLGAKIEAPCINTSQSSHTIIKETIFLGFSLIKEVHERIIIEIIGNRKNQGTFRSLEDFTSRISITLEQLALLIRINSFRSINPNRKVLLWEAHQLYHKRKTTLPQQLFHIKTKQYSLPPLSFKKFESAFEEMELLGFPLCNPFNLLAEKIPYNKGRIDLSQLKNKTIQTYGYLTSIKNTSTSKGQNMQFGTFLDQNGDFLDTVHFPPSARKYPFRGKGVYLLIGIVTEEFDFLSIEVNYMKKLKYIEDPRYA